MISRLLPVSLVIFATACALAAPVSNPLREPDSIVLKDGRTIHGLIIRNTAGAVTIQEKYGENTYPKTDIVRIRDEADIGIAFTDILRKGSLPPWRVIANDLRSRDGIKSLMEIPATTIDNGSFKNVPYISFRANQLVELNIYGNPDNPAGIELGIFGSLSDNDKLRKVLRSYLAGFLTTRAEVKALYDIPFTGGIRSADQITIEITPKTAPDAYGAWWISLYNSKSLDAVRMKQADYERLTKLPTDIVGKNGLVVRGGWTPADLKFSQHRGKLTSSSHVILRGFYRDANGDFRLVTDAPAAPTPTQTR